MYSSRKKIKNVILVQKMYVYPRGWEQNTVQSFYNTPRCNMDLDITPSCCGPKFFHSVILQRNYRKMTRNGHFPLIPM